ncbi:thiamine-phosphate synthase family protein [Methanoregula sp.]|uniref:thiamine-phosphate synthase family protein n=1 Tax=Methanoregula sp. TaxID=2052170 RepID=UPI0035660F6A
MNNPAQERNDVLETLVGAKSLLEKNLHADLVPAEGVSFGYAMRGARDAGGVAAAGERIRPSAEGAPVKGTCAFGCDEEIARVILTAMKFDPRVRSAAILRLSPRAKTVLCDDLFLESASCANSAQPGTGTMDWGIASCCKRGIPDVIFYRDGDTALARILIFGEDPADVVNNIIMCSNRI